MTDHIEPALAPEQWASNLADVFDGYVDLDMGTIDIRLGGPAGLRDMSRELAALIAVCNAALPDDDPRKITRTHVLALRVLSDFVARIPGIIGADAVKSYGYARQLADVLESYLPPE